jgi:hypothetical protein
MEGRRGPCSAGVREGAALLRAALACVLPAAGDSVDGECVGHAQSCELCAVLNTRGVNDPVALICAVSPFLSLGQATST